MSTYIHIGIFAAIAAVAGYRATVEKPAEAPATTPAACVQAYGEPPCSDDAEK